MSNVTVTFQCSVCGIKYTRDLSISPIHENNDCQDDFKAVVFLPQGWKMTERGLMCDVCLKRVDDYLDKIRKESQCG